MQYLNSGDEKWSPRIHWVDVRGFISHKHVYITQCKCRDTPLGSGLITQFRIHIEVTYCGWYDSKMSKKCQKINVSLIYYSIRKYKDVQTSKINCHVFFRADILFISSYNTNKCHISVAVQHRIQYMSYTTSISILFLFAEKSIVHFSHLEPLDWECTALQWCTTKNAARHSLTTGGPEWPSSAFSPLWVMSSAAT